jgi:(p)ppGpp synthase/HD superfamily hydrolase
MNRWSQEGYIKALFFAAEAHSGQDLPGTELPYIMHLSLVSMEVIAALQEESGHDEDLAVQCALLHDIIEDTTVTTEEVSAEFGEAVANGVLALSKDKALPKEQQLEDSLQRIHRRPPEIWMVKLADRISNLQPPPAHWDRERAKAYRDEAIHIRDSLKDASPVLAARLLERIKAYRVFVK